MDSGLGKTVVFGGFSYDSQKVLNDTWIITTQGDTATWRKVQTPANATPSGRYGGFAALDETSHRYFVFSGAGTPKGSDMVNAAQDTWVFDMDKEQGARTRLEFVQRFADRPAESAGPNRLYDGEIAYMDEQIGVLLAALPQGAVVTAVGDHGEMLGEHGELSHGLLLYRGARRVPLIVAGPGVPPGPGSGDPRKNSRRSPRNPP